MPYPAGSILVTGSMVLDVLVRPLDALPPWGATLWVDSIDRHLGGNGAIAAYALGRLGAAVALAGAVGDDDFGHYLLDRLHSVAVDVSQVQVVAGLQTATTIALVNTAAERLFLHVKGASDAADPDQIRLEGCRYFHAGSVFQMARLRAGARSLVERARRAGLITSVDAAWDPQGRWMDDFGPLCPGLDFLFLNQQEARMLAGTDRPEEVGRFFRDRGAGVIVLKMAERGCAISTAGQEFHVPGFAVPAVDTTGAGDCFCAGFLAALTRGCSLPEAGRFANAVAAQSIQQAGGGEGVLGFEDTVAWIEAWRPQ